MVLRDRSRQSVGSSPLTRGKRISSTETAAYARLIPAHAGKTATGATSSRITTAHPRSRGENPAPTSCGCEPTGSSPLTRGKRHTERHHTFRVGLIPAHAGKTLWWLRNSRMVWAHPRSRGENSASALAFSRPHGSSPLTRGKLPRELVDVLSEGLIPAHAGKTPPRASACRRSRAHPRSRGENWNAMRKRSKGAGSSPLTRGKRSVTVPVNITARLIPAHAGKTVCDRACKHHGPAHPRSRGENLVSAVQVGNAGGSSPLTRGKRAGHGRGPGPEGLIPAHAGKTGCRLARGIGARAHPRSRGENARSGASRACRAGSSPLTRGKQAVDWRGGSARGLIPAHAGKTEAGRWSACRCRAHPRSRGENDGQAAHHCVRAGSSPLTRGKRDVGQHVTFLSGLIPAHAGKTWTWPGRNPRPTAHPRSRGENCCMARLMFSAPGSSPLTRGKLLERFWNAMLRGLIPAHAGKTAKNGIRRRRT